MTAVQRTAEVDWTGSIATPRNTGALPPAPDRTHSGLVPGWS
jgi:hypothetical protein